MTLLNRIETTVDLIEEPGLAGFVDEFESVEDEQAGWDDLMRTMACPDLVGVPVGESA